MATSYRLGIDLGSSVTLATYLSSAEVRLLPLGDEVAGIPSVAHVAASGEILVGDEAKHEARLDPEGYVDDPLSLLSKSAMVTINDSRTTGEVVVAKLLEKIVGAAVDHFGGRPQRSVIAHPSHWQGTATSNLMAAAARVGLSNVTLIPADEAIAIAKVMVSDKATIEPAFLGAYGAAVLASKALSDDLELTQPVPMPLVTLEDLDGPVVPPTTKRSDIESIYEPEGPDTVFTEDDGTAQPAPIPQVSQQTPPPAPVAPRVVPSRPATEPRRTGWYAAIGVVAVAILALGGYLLLRDGDTPASTSASDTVVVGTAPTSTPSTAASSTTVAPTTLPPTTLPSTTLPPTTLPTTTVLATTVPPIPQLPGPGPVELSGFGLVLSSGTANEINVPFGFDADAALARIVAVAGEPDSDSGWISDEYCLAPIVRIVAIGDLELIFSGANDDVGALEFSQWFVGSSRQQNPANLVTRRGAGVGVAVGDLELIYGEAFSVQVDQGRENGDGLFQLEDRGEISGTTNGIKRRSGIRTLSAGRTCDLLIE